MQKEMRLTSSSDFANVRVLGNSWADNFFVLAACRRVHFLNNEDYQSRFGFVVSKKIGNAVVRNKCKRRMRESAKLLNVITGYDIVFIARRNASVASFQEVCGSMSRLVDKADLSLVA
tara:strand:+ start:57 stop:410 length:354 start_codon:yes stop_codon:yes gene_type:complete